MDEETHLEIKERERKAWTWVKARFNFERHSLSELAKVHGCPKQTIYSVAHKPSPKYEKIIAGCINRDPWNIWPDRYDDDHHPCRISSRYQGHKRFLESTKKQLTGQEKE